MLSLVAWSCLWPWVAWICIAVYNNMLPLSGARLY